jgi:hypothetical protein
MLESLAALLDVSAVANCSPFGARLASSEP